MCAGSLCWWRGKGLARGSPGLSPPRVGLEPGLVPHRISKASFQVGVTSVGAKPLWGSQRHIQAGKALWGIPVSPLIPRDSTAGVRGSNGVILPCQPSFPSQQQECSRDFSPKRCLMEAGPCMVPTSATQTGTGFVSAAATVIVEGPGFSWTVGGLGFTGNTESPGSGFTQWHRRHWDWNEGLSCPAHPKWGPPSQAALV